VVGEQRVQLVSDLGGILGWDDSGHFVVTLGAELGLGLNEFWVLEAGLRGGETQLVDALKVHVTK
jgi:hypothetical protein